ncbi:MAG: hypothetical protein V7641_2196 [Blastocatellia bacterium]
MPMERRRSDEYTRFDTVGDAQLWHRGSVAAPPRGTDAPARLAFGGPTGLGNAAARHSRLNGNHQPPRLWRFSLSDIRYIRGGLSAVPRQSLDSCIARAFRVPFRQI